MNPMDGLFEDPVLEPYCVELNTIVVQRNRDILQNNKKGLALSRVLEKLPDRPPSTVDVTRSRIRIGTSRDLSESEHLFLHQALCDLKPWRKGPFDIFGIPLDAEWDSSLKWDRLSGKLAPLQGKRVLDIGSSCGYYMFRLAQWQPQRVIGIEPYLNFYFQYLALSRYLGLSKIHCLPLKLEDLPVMHRCFDWVLCMGILYHRRSPLDTLNRIQRMMVPGGQLVLETLILEGDEEVALFPKNRYAKMKNTFFIPTVPCLCNWLSRTGFTSIQCLDVTKTTEKEQRKTDWIDTESLTDFLDPDDSRKTVEGYPAPVRAMILATAQAR